MEKFFQLFILVVFLLPVLGCNQMFPPPDRDEPVANEIIPKAEPLKSLKERKVDGPVLMYYDNGQLKAERVYKDNKLNGLYRTYYENGQLKLEGTYKDDKMDGTFRHFDMSGRLQIEEVYRDNIPVSRKTF